jgi:hypothetical protein
MVDIQSVSIIVAALSVVLGVAYNIYDQRIQTKSRHAQVYLGLWQRLNSKETVNALKYCRKVKTESYDEWMKAYEGDQEYSESWDQISTTFEAIGVFVHEGLLDLRVFIRDSGGVFPRWWRAYVGYIKECRVRNNWPRYYSEMEWLYDREMEFAKRNPEFMIPLE